MATKSGELPAAKFVAALNVPVPSPRRMETLLLPQFATARSGFPSPFRSPIEPDCGKVPTAKFVAGLKEIEPVETEVVKVLSPDVAVFPAASMLMTR